MKSLITALTILLTFNTYSFEISNSPLCQLLESEELQTLSDKQIKAGVEFSELEKKAVMIMIEEMNIYGLEDVETFEDVVKHFEENPWEEAHIMRQLDPATGRTYTYVWSYPGDNEYGIWLNNKNEIIGSVEDSDLVIGNQYCPWED